MCIACSLSFLFLSFLFFFLHRLLYFHILIVCFSLCSMVWKYLHTFYSSCCRDYNLHTVHNPLYLESFYHSRWNVDTLSSHRLLYSPPSLCYSCLHMMFTYIENPMRQFCIWFEPSTIFFRSQQKKSLLPWPVRVTWLEHHPVNWKVVGLILVRAPA